MTKSTRGPLLTKAKERLRLFSLNLHDPSLSSEFPLRVAEWELLSKKIDWEAGVAIFEFQAVFALDRSTMHPAYEWTPVRRPANDDLIIRQIVKVPLDADGLESDSAIETEPNPVCV